MEIFLSVVLLVVSILLVIVVLLQPGKNHRLSGAIAGGAETFFGKSKAKGMEAMLSKATIVLAVIFAILVIVMYVMQETQDFSGIFGTGEDMIVEDGGEVTGDEATGDEATGDEATGDEVTGDEATGDETTGADAENADTAE